MGDWDRRSWEGPASDSAGTAEPDAEEQLTQMRMNVARQRRAVQRKAEREAAGGVAIPAGGGAALDGNVRRKMEGHLGSDLSGVRVHTGGDSAQAATQLGARAFTDGRDIHFNAGQFAPGSKEGDRLLAHELTHVVQGQKSGIQRKGDDEKEGDDQKDAGGEAGGMEVSKPGDASEVEADQVGDDVAEKEHGGDSKSEKKDDDEKKDDEKKSPVEEQSPAAAKAAEAPAKIAAKLEGTARKLFLAPAPTPGPPKAANPDEQWCRNMLTMVPSLDINAPGTMKSLESIGDRYRRCKDTCAALPIYGQLGQAIDTKLSEMKSAGSQSLAELQAFVQGLPQRPPTAAAGGVPAQAPAGPGTAPPASAEGVAGAPQVAPGAATGGVTPQLPPGMTPEDLKKLTEQRDKWLAEHPQRIDPNAGATPGMRIWGQNTEMGAGGKVTPGNEGHVMATDTTTGVHSSFANAEANPQERRAAADATGMNVGTQPGTFKPPFPGANPQQAAVLSGGAHSLGEDKYLGKPMDFDFTLSQQFLAAQTGDPKLMQAFDAQVGAAKTEEAALAVPGAPPSQQAVAGGEFRLGTMQMPPPGPDGKPVQPEARTTDVQAQKDGQPQKVPTTQAQNCGTVLMKRLMQLKILDEKDLAMLHADPEGNFLPNCDLTPQQLADHLRWKQGMWEEDMAKKAKENRP